MHTLLLAYIMANKGRGGAQAGLHAAGEACSAAATLPEALVDAALAVLRHPPRLASAAAVELWTRCVTQEARLLLAIAAICCCCWACAALLNEVCR